MIKVVLIAGFLLLIVYALSQRARSRALSAAMTALSVGGMVLVLFPELSSSLAEMLGVGRGTDLVFYCFILFVLTAIFHIHLRMRELSDTSTILARKIALMSAEVPPEPPRANGREGANPR
ncbi:DUF2304 domain-containing protein [Xanthobacter dioxanivorans]|uniref:DUF2304 domain-containing protein n=1 Tax=Xanthobacter dioxanivorans TaxID=2528964 RepID=A0A974SJI2_9HYPH|nr:DUF2304 domain-containing protein [Xanthobacter dioxanivorans]QRG08426.1 DUF2304 domain-containing protein [Xanthobacter dioxanivorans]